MDAYKNRFKYVYIHGLVDTLLLLFCQLTGPRSQETPAAKIIPSTQSLVLVIIFSSKRNQIPWREMVGSRTGAGNIQDKPTESSNTRK